MQKSSFFPVRLAAEQSVAAYDNSAMLTVDELEAGLGLLDRGAIEQNEFWDRNITAFRRAVVSAIAETLKALESKDLSPAWQSELQCQLTALRRFVDLADRYVAVRTRILELHDLRQQPFKLS
jgi:hypothetical protein